MGEEEARAGEERERQSDCIFVLMRHPLPHSQSLTPALPLAKQNIHREWHDMLPIQQLDCWVVSCTTCFSPQLSHKNFEVSSLDRDPPSLIEGLNHRGCMKL